VSNAFYEIVSTRGRNRLCGAKTRAGETLPGGQIIRLGDGVAHDFPSKENTSFSQCACFWMPKNNDVFRLE
jgi:hypothetical protein